MKFVLIGNYPPDRQESMQRYTLNLAEDLKSANVDSTIWLPVVFFGFAARSTTQGVGKWLGYLDKWMLFPLILRLRVLMVNEKNKRDIFYHVCDHSNSPYLAHLPTGRSGITCHDVLAIRGALGFKDAYCPASKTGRILQNWILSNLKTAKRLACVSEFTMRQFVELSGGKPADANWMVIHNTFNAEFFPMDKVKRNNVLLALGIKESEGYILCVGSSLTRKNRGLLLEMLNSLGTNWQGKLCFAGQPLTERLKQRIAELGLIDRVIEVVKPSHEGLVALYSGCTAFIFPSFSEGFGWPLIEAQACAAAVIASNVEPMLEISGGSALHADPNIPEDFASEFLKILDKDVQSVVIQAGLKNIARFDRKYLIEQFLQLYN